MAKKNHYHIVLQKEDIDSGLKEHMDALAGQKKLTARVKTALTLLAQLESGNTEMLDMMFPQLRKPPAPPTPDNSGLEKRLDYLQKLLEERPPTGIPDDAPMVAKEFGSPPTRQLAAGQGAKKLSAVKLDLPVLVDDDDDTMVINFASGTKNGSNLLAGVLALD